MVSVCYLSEWLQCIPEGENDERARFPVVCWFIPGLDGSTSHDRFSLSRPTIATTWVCIGFHHDRGWKPPRQLSQGHGHGHFPPDCLFNLPQWSCWPWYRPFTHWPSRSTLPLHWPLHSADWYFSTSAVVLCTLCALLRELEWSSSGSPVSTACTWS